MKSRTKVADAVSGSAAAPQLAPLKEAANKKAPTPEEIRQRAFEIYIGRGGTHGYDLDDWLQAERELQEK